MSSSIEWTDEAWNPVVGCTPVSTGCVNCYAARMARRQEAMGTKGYQPDFAGLAGEDGKPGDGDVIRIAEVRAGRAVFTGEVRCLPERLTDPLAWRRPRKVFVNSMSDLFHEKVPFEFVDRVFAVMALCPQHTFQIVTKRPERMAEYLSFRSHGGVTFYEPPVGRERMTDRQLDRLSRGFQWPLPNVWLLTSVEDQAAADARIPHLLRCPAVVRGLSVEPMMGAVDLSRALNIEFSDVAGWMPAINGAGPNIDWVIVGGESGPKARACDVAWIRSIVTQCKAAGVACFVKQMGARPFDSAKMDAVPGSRRPVTDAALRIPEQADQFADVLGKCIEAAVMKLRDRKGGDPAEWPEDLRVREFPEVGGGVA